MWVSLIGSLMVPASTMGRGSMMLIIWSSALSCEAMWAASSSAAMLVGLPSMAAVTCLNIVLAVVFVFYD